MAEKKDADFRQLKQIGVLTTVPIILLVGPIAGYFVGNWIDKRFQFYPWGTISLLILGFVASGREIYRLLTQVLKEDKDKNA